MVALGKGELTDLKSALAAAIKLYARWGNDVAARIRQV